MEQIGRDLADVPESWSDIPVDKACLIGLEFLRHDGLVQDLSTAD